MNNNTKRILLDIGIVVLIIMTFSSITNDNIMFTIIPMILVIVLSIFRLKDIKRDELEKKEKIVQKTIKSKSEKKCKYCQSNIDVDARVCSVCKRSQSIANNPLWIIPITIIILFFGWCLFSNNAPQEAKEIFCGLGIRHGEYCLISTGEYEIEIKFGN